MQEPERPENPQRRRLLKLGEWAVGALVGDLALKVLGHGAGLAGHKVDETATSLLEGLVGSTIILPVWDGQAMYQVECAFSHSSASGYLLTGKRILGAYKDGEECAKLGEDMVKLGLLMVERHRVRMRIDFREIRKRLG